MEEVKYLGVRKNKTGNGSCSWSLFFCPYCKTLVEKIRSNGLRTQSCGCNRDKAVGEKLRKHGASNNGENSRLYRIWTDIKTRCRNKNRHQYKWYGARGIDYCEEWESFEPFLDWALKNGYSETLQIDRIDNDKGYYPENCQWITGVENTRKRSTTKLNVDQVIEIKSTKDRSKNSKAYLATKYSVSVSTIEAIMYNRIWKDIGV